MASFKKKRKDARNRSVGPPKPVPPGPFRHPDGDRRRRGGLTADQGIADKQAIQQFGALIPDDDDPDEDIDDD